MVFVLDKTGVPLMPCTEKRARLLLERGRARVHRVSPFVIRLKDRLASESAFQPLALKIDPGSKITGMAMVRKEETVDRSTGEVTETLNVLNLSDLVHRGRQISAALTQRTGFRRRRRGNLRYRAPRFSNRGNKGEGWLAPSLQHRVDTVMAWVERIRRWVRVSSLSMELVRFDMQKMANPEISGVEYRQGTLLGYEVREYLLEKFGRKCVYCGDHGVPLNIDHVHPKADGGTNRVSNLALACAPCNTKKGKLPVEVFLKGNPELLEKIRKQIQAPLKDAAAVNSTRLALLGALKATGLPVSTGSGGRTKWNRQKLGIPKAHALDAVCVGKVDAVAGWKKPVLSIKCAGRGSYQRTRPDKFGFPRGYLMRSKRVKGFQTGDIVKAVVPVGKKAGTHTGRVAVRASGSFNIQTAAGVVQGVSHRHCTQVQRNDGYGYSTKGMQPPAALLSLTALKGCVSRSNI